MKVAIIGSRGMTENYGGIEKVLCEICPRLVSHGVGVTVYAEGSRLRRFCDQGVNIVEIPSLAGKYSENLLRSAAATALALKDGADLLHFHAIGPSLLTPIPRCAGKPTMATIHGLDWKRDKWPAMARAAIRTAEKVLVGNTADITVVSRQLERHFFSEHTRIAHYIPNGLTEGPSEPDLSPLSTLGLAPDSYLLFAARLVPEKGAHELIEAFQRVKTDKILVIAGSARYDADYARSLQEMADPSRVRMIGHVTGPKVTALFSGAHLFTLPSHLEGSSLSLLEAIGHRRPILVSDIEENLELVDRDAFTFRVGDVEDLATRLQQLLDNPEVMRAQAKLGFERLKTTHSWGGIAARYAQRYESVLRRWRAPAPDWKSRRPALCVEEFGAGR